MKLFKRKRGRRLCDDCRADVEAITVHEHVEIHRKMKI